MRRKGSGEGGRVGALAAPALGKPEVSEDACFVGELQKREGLDAIISGSVGGALRREAVRYSLTGGRSRSYG